LGEEGPPRNGVVGEAIAVLVSGGLDSCVLAGELSRKRTVYPIYIRQGLVWEDVELYWLRQFLKTLSNPRIKPLQLFSLPMGDVYGKHWSVGNGKVPGHRSDDREVYLPGRNLALTVKAAVYCAMHKIPAIAIGSLDHNPFPDATPGFFRAYSRALCMGLGRHVRIETPYRQLSKVEVIKRGRDFPLEFSFSCLAPKGKKHCGQCNKCAERQKAFRKAGVEDKTNYAASPPIPSPGGRGGTAPLRGGG
jgi:7-cyano-7-deazaguanine synthase